MPKRSTVTNLAAVADILAQNLDDGHWEDAPYLDMIKAFVRVKHTELISSCTCIEDWIELEEVVTVI